MDNDQYKELLASMGVDSDKLGCVMLDVDVPDMYRNALPPQWAYYSDNIGYINGYGADYHVTLLYGLIFNVDHFRGQIDAIMEGWYNPVTLISDHIEAFPGKDGDVEYSALVIRVEHPSLNDANNRLAKLPHVQSFPEYKPHVTIGYVLAEHTEEALQLLKEQGPCAMPCYGLRYTN